jgi:hypothetical protein
MRFELPPKVLYASNLIRIWNKIGKFMILNSWCQCYSWRRRAEILSPNSYEIWIASQGLIRSVPISSLSLMNWPRNIYKLWNKIGKFMILNSWCQCYSWRRRAEILRSWLRLHNNKIINFPILFQILMRFELPPKVLYAVSPFPLWVW